MTLSSQRATTESADGNRAEIGAVDYHNGVSAEGHEYISSAFVGRLKFLGVDNDLHSAVRHSLDFGNLTRYFEH